MGWSQKVPAAKAGGGGDGQTWETPPEDNHVAILVGIYDQGSREQMFEGNSTGWRRRVALIWELASAEKSDGSPFYVVKEFTYSTHEKAALRQWMEKWRCKKYVEGDDIDIGAALGKPCLLTIVHTSNKDGTRVYANVDGISKLPAGMPVRKPTYPTLSWQIGEKNDDGTPVDPPEDEWLPYLFGERLCDRVKISPEYNGRPVPRPDPRRAVTVGGGATTAAAAASQEEAEQEIPF